MKYNNFNSCLGPNTPEHRAWREGKGFVGRHVSTDGNWIVGDLGNRDMHMVTGFDADALPQYMKDLGITSCCLTHEETRNLVLSKASSKGASDGWMFMKDA